MKKLIYLYISSIIVIALGACDNYLDIQPKGVKEPSTVIDMRQIMDDLYRTMENTILMGDDVYKPEVASDALEVVFKDFQAYTWGPHLYLEGQNDADWNLAYSNIYRFNTVLERIDDAESDAEGTEEVRKQTKGEALFFRAYFYFILVNQYGKQYDESTSSTDPGVPLRLTPDVYAENTRATVAAVYEQIIKDLEIAIELLSADKNYNYKPSKVAANLLLSKVYLYQRKFELARTYADNTLSDYDLIIDYNDHVAAPFPDPRQHPEYPFYIWSSNGVYRSGAPNDSISGVYFSPELLSLYESGDLRTQLWQKQQYATGLMFDSRHGFWFVHFGLCIPDAYLIRAECNARLGDKDAAMDDINAIRVKRLIPAGYTPLTATNAADALDKVLEERRREMAFLNDRWFDMKRLDVDPVYQRSYTRTLGGETFTLEVNSNRFVMAIPENVIQLSNMEQNPR